MLRYLKIYCTYLRCSIKILRVSRSNFVIGFIAFLAIQTSALFFLSVTLGRMPDVKGFSYSQILFIFGFAQLPRGLDHFYSDFLWVFARKVVVVGDADKYFVRPISPFFQVICERIQFDSLGEIVTGIAIMLYAIPNIIFAHPFISSILFVLYVICGCIIYTSLKTISASFAFWIKRSDSILQSVYGVSDLAQYPTVIYPYFIRLILLFIIPFGLISFSASTAIFDGLIFSSLNTLIIIVTAIFLFLAMVFWKRGLSAYESAGN